MKRLLACIAACVELERKTQLDMLCSAIAKKFGRHELSFYAYAASAYLSERVTDAEELLTLCVKLNPNFVDAYILYAHLLFNNNAYFEALENYLEAAGRLSNIELQFCCVLTEKFVNGLQAGEKYICDFDTFSKSSNPFILNELGVILYYDKSFELACEHFLRLLKHLTKSKAEPVLLNLPFLLEKSVDRYWNPVYFNLGYTLFKLKKYCNAVACFQKAVTNGQNRYLAWEMIGYCYGMLGMFYCANDAMFKADTLNPEQKNFIPLL